MKIVYLISSLFLCSNLLSSPIDATHYQEYADQWISENIQAENGNLRISAEDFHLVLNLVYFSYQRSAITLTAQDIALNAIKSAWRGWQNIAQTRLNPSLNLPFPENALQDRELFDQFITAQRHHRTIGKTYSIAIEGIIHGALLTSLETPLAIERLRQHARTIVLDALTNIKQQLVSLSTLIQNLTKNNPSPGFFRERILSLLPQCVVKGILSLVPTFALSSFIKMESGYTIASTKTWDCLEALQKISVFVYAAIEQERAAYYAAHYNALMKVFKKQKLKAVYRSIAFDENGLIPSNQRAEMLPLTIA